MISRVSLSSDIVGLFRRFEMISRGVLGERVSVQLAELDKTLAKQSLKDHELSG